MSTSLAQTTEEPTYKPEGLQAAAEGLQAADIGFVEWLGFHLAKGAVKVLHVKKSGAVKEPHVKETDGQLKQLAADVKTVKVAIITGVCMYGVCVVGSCLKNIFQRGRGGRGGDGW